MVSAEIAYGEVEPGDNTGNLTATSVALNIGNTGLDQEVLGDSMCETYSVGSPCPLSSTSTIPEDQQQFTATSGEPYGSGLALSSTTQQEVEINVPRTTGTTSADYAQGTIYWGIAVPGSISLAGIYTGMNTYYAAVAEAVDWGI
jgi:hypothetical protein